MARRTADLTQRQLAALVDVDPIQISRWERGSTGPNEDHLIALCVQLKRELPWFYADHAEAVA